ncbi:g3428 [Coccomyxa elongata]
MAFRSLVQEHSCVIYQIPRLNYRGGAPGVLCTRFGVSGRVLVHSVDGFHNHTHRVHKTTGPSTCFANVPSSNMDGIMQEMKSNDFPARTVDYDADSDSMDEFSAEGYSEDDLEVVEEFIEDRAAAIRDAEEDMEDEEGEPAFTSTSGEGPIVELAGLPPWGQPALGVAKKVLNAPEMESLELYSFRAAHVKDRLYIRIDKLDDLYGSPTLDEVEAFSREFYKGLEAALGAEGAGKLSIEISSPGAERIVRIPRELERFGSLPMQVTFLKEPGSTETNTRVLSLLEMDEEQGTTRWGLADVKENRRKGVMKLSKKESAITFDLPISSLQLVKLHLEI